MLEVYLDKEHDIMHVMSIVIGCVHQACMKCARAMHDQSMNKNSYGKVCKTHKK